MDIGSFLAEFVEDHPDAVTGRIAETNRMTMLNKTDQGRWRRGVQVNSVLYNVRAPYIFYVSSRYTGSPRDPRQSGTWLQIIQAPIKVGMDLNSLKRALMGDIKIWCNCPDFKFHGLNYIVTKAQDVVPAGGVPASKQFFPQVTNIRVPPKIRNPRQEGMLCKHLYSTLSKLSADAVRVHKELSKGTPSPDDKNVKSPDRNDDEKDKSGRGPQNQAGRTTT